MHCLYLLLFSLWQKQFTSVLAKACSYTQNAEQPCLMLTAAMTVIMACLLRIEFPQTIRPVCLLWCPYICFGIL